MKSYIEELINILSVAQTEHQKVAFVGWNDTIVQAIARKIDLDVLTCIFTSDAPSHMDISIGRHCMKREQEILAFDPDKVVILTYCENRTLRLYERLIREFRLSPKILHIPEAFWDVHQFINDNSYRLALSSIPDCIEGGTSEVTPAYLYDGINHVVRKKIPGIIVNLGVFKGWSMHFIANLLKHNQAIDRTIIGFDTFRGFSKTNNSLDVFCDTSQEFRGAGWELYKDTSIKMVYDNLKQFPNISLVAGDIKDTIAQLPDGPVALAFFDMDDYTPTKVALEPIYERLSSGGIMVFDHFEYYTLSTRGRCIGQRIAMLEFLEKHPMFNVSGTNLFMKT